MRSLRLILIGLVLMAGLLVAPGPAAAAPQRPNIIFIMSDDHAVQAIGAYGSRINQTPNIDRLAREGVRFSNAFVTNSICGPSRATILTGQYSHLNGFRDNHSQFDGSQTTFPKLMQQAGYKTAIFGKWHLVSDPTGFDEWCILPGQGVYHNPQFIHNGEKIKTKGYVSDIITDMTLDWLKKQSGDQPFCLLMQHKAPHRSWEPPARYATLYDDTVLPVPANFNDDYATRSDAARMQDMTIDKTLNKNDLKQDPPAGLEGPDLLRWKYDRYIKDYLRCVQTVDDSVGRLLNYLDKSGLAENTIVIYTSDQGFYLGEHGWFDKRWMYEESLRTPLLVRMPGAAKPGSVSDAMVLNLDYAQTILDLAGAPIPESMQGRSMKPILEGNTPLDWRMSMYYHYYEYPVPHRVLPHYGVRSTRYKLIHFYQDIDAWELYDLFKDPQEMTNVYDQPAYAEVQAQMHKLLLEQQKRYGDTEPEKE